MSRPSAPPVRSWKSFDFRGRPFFFFPLPIGDARQRRFTVAQQIADRYAVRDVLARGGNGIILEADDHESGNRVFVKALAEYDTWRYDLEEPIEEFVEALRRSRHHLQTERRILVQLRNSACNSVPHPNDYVFDANPALKGPHRTESGEFWEFDDPELLRSEPYLVMQCVPGRNLQDVLDSRHGQGLEETLAVRIIDQVARVVELLEQPLKMPHAQKWELVYQDLKPRNILVDRQGRATVLDFGGCQLLIDQTLVLHGSHSPGFCAPECGTSDGPITAAADCYSLGATLFHMLSGISPRRLLPKKRSADAPRAVRIDLKLLSSHCRNDLVTLLSKCLAWEPEARFQNASEFRAALAPLLK